MFAAMQPSHLSHEGAALDCVIVGAGPAGLTAATYLARYRRHIVVLDAGDSRARWIPSSHNCPGFPMGVAGNDLLARYREHAVAYGVDIHEATVTDVERHAGMFEVTATEQDGEHRWAACKVVLATGVVDRLPPMEGRDEAIAQGVLRLCAVCDAYEALDQQIAVIGDAAAAIPHATYLRTFSRNVCALVCDGDRGDGALHRTPEGVQVRTAPEHLALAQGRCEARFADGDVAHFDTIYPVLGADVPLTMTCSLRPATDAGGALYVSRHMETDVPGLYAIGDLVSGLNQISVAVGHAAIAATAIHRALPQCLA